VELLGRHDSEGFFCDHVVEELYKRATMAICYPIEGLPQAELLQKLFRQGREKIREMPTMIRTTPVEGSTSLRVSWNNGYTRLFSEIYGPRVKYLLVLHGTACIAEAEKLIYRESFNSCDCPSDVVPENVGSPVFEGLDGQARFPMVARFEDGSIYGVPPPPMSPAGSFEISRSSILSAQPQVHQTQPLANSPTNLETSNHGLAENTDMAGGCGTGSQEHTSIEHDGLRSTNNDGGTHGESGIELNVNGHQPESETQTSATTRGKVSISNDPASSQLESIHHDYLRRCAMWESWGLNEARQVLGLLQDKPKKPAVSYIIRHEIQWTALTIKSNHTYRSCDRYQGFTRGQYTEAILREDSSRYILYVHDIQVSVEGEESAQLLVSKYVFLGTNPAFLKTKSTSISPRELILYFTEFDLMAKKEDAEVISVGNVTWYPQEQSCIVHHVIQMPGRG
jgi:hypothetical protein